MFKIPKRDNIGLRDVKGKFTMKVLAFKKKVTFCMCYTKAHVAKPGFRYHCVSHM